MICHGYACGCLCTRCSDRATKIDRGELTYDGNGYLVKTDALGAFSAPSAPMRPEARISASLGTGPTS